MTHNPDDDFYEREYNAFLRVGDFRKDEIYRDRSRAALQQVERIADIVYDDQSGSRLDLYPAGAGSPLFIWIHGGYWRGSSKDENVFVVPGLVAHGISVASLDYSLAPSVSIGEIVRQVRQGIAWLHGNASSYDIDTSHLHLGGHSAGGHLVGMLLAPGWLTDYGLRDDLFGAALAVSGLFDLAPIRRTSVNEQLRLDDLQIADYSPIWKIPARTGTRLLTSFGGNESSEFARQSLDYLSGWQAAGNAGRHIAMPGYHHFDIILDLEQPGNPLFDGLVEEVSKFRVNDPGA